MLVPLRPLDNYSILPGEKKPQSHRGRWKYNPKFSWLSNMIDVDGRRLILVTGSPRSGTTAVGDMLSLPLSAGYLHEPFNVTVGIRDVENQFEAVGARSFSAERLDAIMRGIITLRLRWKSGVRPTDRGVRRLVTHLVGGRARLSFMRCLANPFLKIIIWKDPLAALLVDEMSTSQQSQG